MYLFLFMFSLATLNEVSAEALKNAAGKECIHVHNRYRRSLANGEVKGDGITLPKATDMNLMRYSTKLGDKAQELAAKCDVKTRPPRGVLHYSTSQKLDEATAIMTAIENWWDRVKYFNTQDVHYTFLMATKELGNFAQIALSTNTEVGCAVQDCSTSGTYVVCQYDKQLQFNDLIYKTGGEPCSDCVPNRKFCHDGMCSKCAPKP
ncbi:hypothetical protein M3Y94_00036400 [Aphelenchoides besseyi]|nr:hypothetical protein M3Y94_00036400 [Aphelenchoides besseyi]KAI6219053.1 SCP-like protein [Aphelenchoides besseyi]